MTPEKQPEAHKGYMKGELLYTIFQNEESYFSIAKIKVHDTNEDYAEKEIVVKGHFTDLLESTVYCFYGTFEKHVKFGLQYQVETYHTLLPDTKDGLIAYLSSEMFYGVGKKTAKKIVTHLGVDAISTILNDDKALKKVPEIKKEKAEHIVKVIRENQGFEHIVVHLSHYGIGLKMAQKIYQAYKDEALEVLQNDPYQYVFDIDGFGFQTADYIAGQNGISLTHPNRIGAGCIYVLQKSIQDGHVYLPVEQCSQEVLQLLRTPDQSLTDEIVYNQLEDLNKAKKLIMVNGNVYLPSLYYAENGFASSIKRLMEQPLEYDTTLASLMKIIGDIEEKEVLSYGNEQFDAINEALQSKLSIVTGGPGTGKTTVIKGIIKAYAAVWNVSDDPHDYDSKSDFPFILTAPTGRAAKRLSESTGLPSVTIHRLLGWDGKGGFEKNEHEQLAGKFLIVDEFSMVDIWLANSLFHAIPDDMQVLLVGDEDQLPSVGPGQVLADLLNSGLIPYSSLQEVYRQKEGSKIIQLAHLIKHDNCDTSALQNDEDFSFIACSEQQMIDVIIKVFKKAKNKGIDLKDIQVLAPMYRSIAGINEINKQLQAFINPKTQTKREIKVNDLVYRIGDKVLQLVNQPEDGVFNGDIGEVVAIFEEDENIEHAEQLVIDFEGKEVVYERKDYINIMHAYCISIHKSQGSEFPIILMPVVSSYRRMLRKNLLYTAITRSQKSLIICGQRNAFLQGVQTLDTNRRYTSLKEQLQERLEAVESREAGEEKEITPYDFM